MRRRKTHRARAQGSIAASVKQVSPGEIKPEQLESYSDLSTEEAVEFIQAWSALPKDTRYELIRRLVEIGEVDFSKNFDRILSGVLIDKDPRVRRTAIRGLSEASSPQAITSMIELLGNERDESVVRQLLETLSSIAEYQLFGDDVAARMVDALMAKSTRGESSQVRREALAAVTILHNDEQVSALVHDAYESRDEDDVIFAVRAMGRLGVSNWRREIQQALRHPDEEIRAEAVIAVGASGNQKFLSTIVQMALEEVDDVQIAAIWTLGEIGGAAAVQTLEQLSESEDPEIAKEAANALEQATLLEDFTSAPRLGSQSSPDPDEIS